MSLPQTLNFYKYTVIIILFNFTLIKYDLLVIILIYLLNNKDLTERKATLDLFFEICTALSLSQL